jgi:hypothetical protein
MECSYIIGILIQNSFDNLLALELLLPRFASPDAILKLQLLEKTISHVVSLCCGRYEKERKIISKISLITKEKSETIVSKSLNASILSCKNKTK